MTAGVPPDIAEIISGAGVAAMNRCQCMAGGDGTVAIHERYLSAMMAAELWERLNVKGSIKCDVVAEATYTEFYKRHHPNATKDELIRLHGGERIDVQLTFAAAVPADVLIEIKLYDDGKKFAGILKDREKLRRVADNSRPMKCYLAMYVTQVRDKADTSLTERIDVLTQKIGAKVIAGQTQRVSAGWEWCFATLEVSAV